MKRVSLFLTILVTMLHAHLYAATFTASQIEITPGKTAQLVIGMNNTETNLSGFQFKLYLPEGLSVTTNTNGQFVYTQSGRIANHTVNFRALNDGGYLVVVYSMDANVITSSSDELMSISITADENASTSGNGTLSNIRITDVSSSTSSCNDVPIDVTILNAHLHDATFTASQIEITPGRTAQLVIGMNTTETNLSGFQFKLYLPEGLSVTTNDKGQFVYTKSGRIANHTVNFRALNDGGYLVVVYSMDADVITGSSGDLMSISVTADETASTSGNGTLSNIRITDVSSNTSSCNDVPIDVTIDDYIYTVTYIVKDTNGNIIFTSDSEPSELNAKVTTLPTKYQRAFYTYDEINISVTNPNTIAEFTATWNGPFEISTDFANAHWYNIAMRGTWYVTSAVKDDGGAYKPQNANTMSLMEESYHWAFIGNGYGGFKIINKAEGDGKSFGWTDATATNAGIPTIMSNGDGHHAWKIVASTNTSVPAGSFCLNVPGTNLYINQFGGVGGAMKFWDSANNIGDIGSAFTVFDIPNNFLLTLTASGNGAVSYGNTSVRSSSQSFDVAELSEVVLTITPDACHHVESLTVNGEDALSQLSSDGKLSIGSMTASVTIAVTFAANVIDFADAGVKALCVANWDTNGDGELDEAEAAAVTDIGTVFSDNKAITSFNELLYFTGLTNIGKYAFEHCSSLTSVTIPNRVITIGESAFYYCSNLTSITIPESVASIGEYAFFVCSGLTSLTIPESVTNIKPEAFGGCDGLTSIKVQAGNTIYDSRNDCNAIIETATNTLITGCQNTVIPNSVTRIGKVAFYGCSGLTSVTIPNSVTSISYFAFFGCDGLTSLTIPESVTSVESSAVVGCSGLTSIKVETGNTKYDSRNDCNAIIETASNKLITGCQNTVIPNSVTAIEQNAFCGCSSMASITIPESVTSIGYAAFKDCSSLTSIIIPNSVTSIDISTFYGCRSLAAVTIGNGVTSIGSKAFGGCSGLTEVYCYAEQVPNTSSDAFSETNIENATLYVPKGSVESYKVTSPWSGFGTIVAIASTSTEEAKVGNLWYAFDTGTKQATVIASKDDEYSGNIVIPASVQYQDETYAVTEIDGSAFNGCSGLTAVTIPNSVTGLPRFGFSGCNNLATVTLDCWAIISKVYPGQSSREFARLFGDQVKECIIGNSVTYIGNLFEDCSSIESITIGSNVEEIRFGAFRGCDLVSITVNPENSTYDSRDNCNAIIDTNNNILVLGCRNTVIPSSVKSIDARAFYCCSLTSITIPSSVTLISTEAFYGCTSLTNITSYIKEPFAISDNVFNGIPYETATLFVPAGTIDAYKTTDGWKNFQNIEAIPQQLTISAVGDGTVTYSGQALTGTTATFKVAGEVQLLLTPEEDCHIERVMVNQQDYTSQVTDGVLTLNVVDEDYFVLAEFQHNIVIEPEYVTYTIYIDGLGDVRVKNETLSYSEQTIRVPQGGDLVLEFLPDEGQMVDKVTWNGETVTEQALGNTFVVRNVMEDGTVSVIFMERIETFEYAGIRYGVTDNTNHIVKVLPYDYSGHLSVPESFEHSQRTWQVQEIGSLAFANCEWLVSVKIPTSITKTGTNLFKRDTRLAAIQWDAQLNVSTKVTGELTNANMLYYVKDRSYAPQGENVIGNVIVNGMADNISLSDGHDFYCPEAFKAKKIAYNHIYKMLTRRNSCQGWEALVLPFDVKTIRLSRNPDNPEIYPYESLTDDQVVSCEKLPFWLYSYDDNDEFTPAASIEANTPYIISMPNDVAYLPMFRLAGNVTFSAQDDSGVDVYCTSDENLKVPGTQRHFQPSYQRKAMGNDCLLINVNDSVNHQFAEGSMFIHALRPSRPFEAYMVSQTSSVKPWYGIFEQLPTGIRDIPAMDNEEEMANGKWLNGKCYDLSGRQIVNSKLSNCKLHRGIYIINGKKQVIK